MQNQSRLPIEEDSQIQIYFSARQLVNLDIVSDTDSYLKIYLKETNKPREFKLQTKVYWNDLSPDYAETLIYKLNFDRRIMVEVEVYHEEKGGIYIGKAQASIGQIFGSRKKGVQRPIVSSDSKEKGKMLMKCEKLSEGKNKFIQFQVSVQNLPIGCFCWLLYRKQDGTEFLALESSEKVAPNPNFGRIKINQDKLCYGREDFQVLLSVMEYHEAYAPTFYGKTTFSIRSLSMRRKNQFSLTNQNGIRNGVVTLENISRYSHYSFQDYLLSGLQMALVICIDFTQSNKQYTDPHSLHYTTHNKTSRYEDALQQVTTILMDFDADKLVPTYGFGAKVKMPGFDTRNKTSHFFPLNGNLQNPNFLQTKGVMEGYRKSMKYLQFSYPTYFAPLLQQLMKDCQKMKKQQKQYMILLILTDGQIFDEETVEDLLVKCGKLPLSIIIVGIGEEGDWGIMHRLDDDECLMVDKEGNRTTRDLVQFVQFSKYKNDGVELAKQVLFELPRQVEEYHELVGLTPQVYKKNIGDTDAFHQKVRH